MISERVDHPPFDNKATRAAIDQSQTRKLPIDTLPTELLEWVIGIGATTYEGWRPDIKRICEWRRVCWKWASVIDHCSGALWSYIVVSPRTGHVRTQFEKSKEAPLMISIGFPRHEEERTRLLFDNVRRWKAISFHSYWREFSAMLDSSPPMLEVLVIHQTTLLPDSKLFNPPSPNLRVLRLSQVAIPSNIDSKFFNPPSPTLRVSDLREVTIPSNIQPILGLEELHLSCIDEILEDGTVDCLSGRKLHQFLQASPGLRVLQLVGRFSASAADKSLQPVDLPNLERLEAYSLSQTVLSLFRPEHCACLAVNLELGQELPPGAWTATVPTLRRAKGLEVDLSEYLLRIGSLVEPPTIRLSLELDEQDTGPLSYLILEEILQELEYESCLSARIELGLYTRHRIGILNQLWQLGRTSCAGGNWCIKGQSVVGLWQPSAHSNTQFH